MSSRQRDLFVDDEPAHLFGEDFRRPYSAPTRTRCGRNATRFSMRRGAAQTMPWD